MRKIIILFTVVTISLLIGCKPNAKGTNGITYSSAVEYNDYIVKKQQDLMTNIINLSAEQDVNKFEKTINDMIPKIDQSIKDIQGMPAWNGDTILRNKALDLFKFYREACTNEFATVIKLLKDVQTNPDNAAKIQEITSAVSKKEESFDDAIQKAQEDFAKENNMEVKANSMQQQIDGLKK